jgi:hypothetical protein
VLQQLVKGLTSMSPDTLRSLAVFVSGMRVNELTKAAGPPHRLYAGTNSA